MTVHRKTKGGIRMNHELFSSMHDMLDYIIEHYDQASDSERVEYCQHIQELKQTNDYVMDHWISFEEKLAQFFEKFMQHEEQPVTLMNALPLDSIFQKEETATLAKNFYTASNFTPKQQETVNLTQNNNTLPCNECDLFDIEHPQYEKAIGYYKLLMFDQSSEILQQLLLEVPECNRARLYYAMSLLHLQKWDEAKRQFQLLTVLSDFPKWLALSYNALGCLQAIACHMGEAEKLFRRAYQIYPEFQDALKNLECCTKGRDEICLYFGSTELITM